MIDKEEYLVENISINNINKTINNYILEHKKKFIRFKFDCKIGGVIDKYSKNKKVTLYITFYSDKEDLTHNYYLKFPKPMIEYKLLKILDKTPLLIKSLGACLDPIPLIRFIIFKYWGYINNKNELVYDYNWYESDPKHPSQDLLDFIRLIDFIFIYYN